MIRRLAAITLLFGLVLLGAAHTENAHAQSGFQFAVGQIINVLDADTIDIDYISGGDGLPGRLQMYAINSPDFTPAGAFSPPFIECYGEEARTLAEGLLLNQTVWISHQNVVTEVGLVDRLSALVYLDSDRTSLYQGILMSQGAATSVILEPEEQFLFPRFIQLEAEARLANRGLWEECDPRLYQDR